MKFGEEEEFTFPQPDGSFWTPGIQQEPVMLGGSNPSNNDSIQEENQRENINWAELVGIYSDFLQEKEKCADVQSNPVVQTPRSIVYPTSRILNPTSYSQIQNNWTELHPMLMHTRQASNQQQMSSYAFPIPYHSPSFATPPQTPDHGRLLRNQQLLAMGGSLFYQEKQQQENASSYVQEMQTQSCNQLLDSVVALSSFSPSSSLKTSLNKDNYISEDGANGGIDLNKTPKQNTPKRKKHRPKVVVEGKPKRTPRPTTPSNTQNRTSSSSLSSSSGKRKYVRKSGLGDDSISQSIEKSCRRMLNFEFEVAAQVQGNDQQTTPSMGLNRRDAEQEQQQLNDKFPSLSTSMAPRDHHTLNVIARNINLKNATTHQNQLGCNKVVHQQIHGEVMAQMPLHPNNETDQVMLQTRIESINSVLPEPNEKRGCKRDYSSITKLTPSPTNLMPLNESRKSKIQGKRHHRAAATSIMTSCNTNVKKSSRQVQYKGSTPYNNGSPQSSDLEEKNWPQGQASVASGSPNYQYKDPTVVGNNIHGQRYSSQVKMQRNCMAGQILKEYTESHRASLLTQQNMPSPLQRRILNTTRANETETPKPVKRQMVEHNSSATPLNKEAKVLKDLKKETGNVLSSRKATGKNEKWDHEMKIEEITPQLKQMQITHNGQTEVGGEKETALEGDEMTNVPCEVDPIRRRKPRLKVDLDPDAKKLWLVGKHGSESKETMSKEEEYWKKEREVFHGRVNRFISLLSLFQGNRQFSSWKGSVVDSVIGVFLTQNVADHLSSSAFMSLAAEFPPPRTLNLAREREEQEGQIIDPDGTITYHGRTLRQTLYNHNTGTSSQPSEKRSVHVINEAQIHLVKENKHQEGFSSQISSESSVLQANGDVQSSSDSEVENQVTLCSSIMCQSFKNTLQTGRAASIQQHHSHETRSPSLDNMPAPECQKQPSPVCNRHNSTSNIGNDVYGSPINSKNLFSEGSFVQKQNACMSPSAGPSGNETTKIPKPRKKKLNEKTNSFDWESLRAQAVLKAEKQKRSKDRMDLLNYEALRQADVKKIAGIIKERGMNNMLAKRIKDFLNRLVRDHGSIDLEWLRDIPPDKAKEYLLSIPGLGLKSVECVRLLTLHHIAFPVDINVARIVVRLGWVPLQPLPEPLSFHQLELYPTLESVQKYLWPRLCKLDHKTLYELHYQMITFGKVFCTKLLPNCNGCPMKKECRHFANASASARPALPGPEERSIVSSTTPVAPNGSPPAVLKPVPLSLSETNKVSGSQYIISSQQAPIAIVELPEAASDIEDTVYQDTNEIPNTNFHLEGLDMFELDLTKERNEGLSEAALSQALVALNPQDVSIPAPKLKNENRLRTEHQVYEIPDSHPILEGMDKRDPGDTTPYLLAIWMPGETENSTQPPKSICNFQGTGKLCNDETCFQCNSVKETNSQIVRGTLLIPYLTATRGAFPLNGTYFQINEVFADHESSHNPINVPRDWLWKLERRTVYFGTSVSAIARGFSSTEVQNCFWRGSVCVRAFDRETRSPKSLVPRLHCSPGKKLNNKNQDKEKQK